MKTIYKAITLLVMATGMASVATAKSTSKPEILTVLEPCRIEGECEFVYDADLDWREQAGRVIENKVFVNPVFHGKLTAVQLKNVVFVNGKLGKVDLSEGSVLTSVVFRGNQIDSLNLGGATLNEVVVEGNLKQQPIYGSNGMRPAEAIPLNLRDAVVNNSIFVNNVMFVNGNKNTVIRRTSFTRNNMVGSKMRGVQVVKSDFSGNDARDSDLRFASATDLKIVSNQVHGAKYPKSRKTGVAIFGNWVNIPVKEWLQFRIKGLQG